MYRLDSMRKLLPHSLQRITHTKTANDEDRSSSDLEEPTLPLVAYFWLPLSQTVQIDPGPHYPDIEEEQWPNGFVRSSEDAPIESYHVSLMFNQIPGVSRIDGLRAASIAQIMTLGFFQSGKKPKYPTLSEAEAPSMTTIVEAAIDLPTGWNAKSREENLHLRSALDAVLMAIRVTLLGAHQTSREALIIPTLERLPPILPFAITDSSKPLPRIQTVAALQNDLGEHSHNLLTHSETIHELPLSRPIFANYFSLRNDAEVALEFRGEYRSALILYAAAAESLLNTWLSLLLWEENRTPEEAATQLSKGNGILKRARSVFPSLIGGTWTRNAKNGAGDWQQLILEPRNVTIHTGCVITRTQAYSARAALDNSRKYIGGLIFLKSKKFPFTAAATGIDLMMTPANSPEGPRTAFEALRSRYDRNAFANWTTWKNELDALLAFRE